MLFQFSYDILVCLFCSAGAVVELHRRRKVDLLHKRRAFGLRAKTQADTIVGKMVSFSISAMNNCRMCTQKSSLVKQAWVANAKYVSEEDLIPPNIQCQIRKMIVLLDPQRHGFSILSHICFRFVL